MIMFVKLLMSIVVGVQARLRDFCLFDFLSRLLLEIS